VPSTNKSDDHTDIQKGRSFISEAAAENLRRFTEVKPFQRSKSKGFLSFLERETKQHRVLRQNVVTSAKEPLIVLSRQILPILV
jgi:hypothetical protein